MKHKALVFLLIFFGVFVYTALSASADDVLQGDSADAKSGPVAEALSKISFLQGTPMSDADYYYYLHLYLYDCDSMGVFVPNRFRELKDFVTEYPEMRKNKIEVILIVSHVSDTMSTETIRSYIQAYQINFPVVLANSIGNIRLPGNIQPSISRDEQSDNCYYRYNTVHHYIVNKEGKQLRRFAFKFHDYIDHQQAIDWRTVCNITNASPEKSQKKPKGKVAKRLSRIPYFQGEANLKAKYYCYLHAVVDPDDPIHNVDPLPVFQFPYYSDIIREYPNLVKKNIEVILIISNPYHIASQQEIKRALHDYKIPFPVVLATDIGAKPLPGDKYAPVAYTYYANHEPVTSYYCGPCHEFCIKACIVNAEGKTMPTLDWESLGSEKQPSGNNQQQTSTAPHAVNWYDPSIDQMVQIIEYRRIPNELISKKSLHSIGIYQCANIETRKLCSVATIYQTTNYIEMMIRDPSFDINKADSQGRTALIWLCRFADAGYHPEGVASITDEIGLKRLLAIPGIDVNKADAEGKTPLHHVCINGAGPVECLRILLDHPNINVNARDNTDKTPLWYAKYNGRNDVRFIRHIIDAGGTL